MVGIVEVRGWKYSSARNYTEDDTILKIDNEGMHLGLMDF